MRNLIILSFLFFALLSCKNEKRAEQEAQIQELEAKIKRQDSLKQVEKELQLKQKEMDLAAKEQTLNQREQQQNEQQKQSARRVIYSSGKSLDSDYCREVISGFVRAEDNRNYSRLKSFLSSDMERYWKIKNPSNKELFNTYKSAWQAMEYSYNSVQDIEKINNNTYDLHTNFTFQSSKTGEVKTIANIVRFKLNDDYKIYYINER